MTSDPGHTPAPAPEAAARDAARLEAHQWLGYWVRQARLCAWTTRAECEAQDAAWHRGFDEGLRPDAAALATARAEGYAAGRESVLRVVRRIRDEHAPFAALHPTVRAPQVVVRTCEVILAECTAATPATEAE